MQRVALHEAGHCVIAHVLGIGHGDVSIVADATSQGRVEGVSVPRHVSELTPEARKHGRAVTVDRMNRHIMTTVAGAVAELATAPGWRLHDVLKGDDRTSAMVAARALWPADEEDTIAWAHVELQAARVQVMLRQPTLWDAVWAVATELLERHELTSEEVARILLKAGVPQLESDQSTSKSKRVKRKGAVKLRRRVEKRRLD